MQRQIARERVNGQGGAPLNPGDRFRHFVHQGLHVTGVAGIPHGQGQGKHDAGRWVDEHPGCAAKLGGAVTLPLAHGGDGRIIGIDDFAMAQGLALGQASRWVGDPVMRIQSGRELDIQTCLWRRRQGRGPVQVRLSRLRQGPDWFSQLQPWGLGPTDQG
jgi:hypothetical protein